MNISAYIDKAREAGACDYTIQAILESSNPLEHGDAPYWAFWYCTHVERVPELESIMLQEPEFIYLYAMRFGAWPEGEAALLEAALLEAALLEAGGIYLYFYAKNVLKRRWPECEHLRDGDMVVWYVRWLGTRIESLEATIATDAGSSYTYAVSIVKDRFVLGEAAIAADPWWGYCYARDVLKERWPMAEAAILTDARCAYYYIIDVLKEYWPEAESILKGSDYEMPKMQQGG